MQVTGPAEPGKALPVSTRLLFKSRLAIVTPDAPGLNISRRIKDEDRRGELEAIAVATMKGSAESLGLIVRSAAAFYDDAEIVEDIALMRDLAGTVLSDLNGGPELLIEGAGAHETAWRDWADPVPDEVIEGGFETEGLHEMIAALRETGVALVGGGNMAIEVTRALVAIDVNTGPDTSPAAALKVNIAAARELPRQLRLRGLGGQVVIDFAPMPKKERAILDQVIRSAFKTEAAETNLAGWTGLGLFELTRKRDRLPLRDLLP